MGLNSEQLLANLIALYIFSTTTLALTLTAHQFGFLPGRLDLQQLLIIAEAIFNIKLTQAEVDCYYGLYKKSF